MIYWSEMLYAGGKAAGQDQDQGGETRAGILLCDHVKDLSKCEGVAFREKCEFPLP